jgi:hypothetical protein
VIYGTIVSQIIFVLIPYSFYLPKLLGPACFLTMLRQTPDRDRVSQRKATEAWNCTHES